MKDLLVILSPRRIPECIAAFDELQVEKLWIRCMREVQIAAAWETIMDAAAGFDFLILISDDGIVRPHALRNVSRFLHDGMPVVTGYSNLSATDMRVNLTKSPLGPEPAPNAYDLLTLAEAMEHRAPFFRTWFAGMCLTGMPYSFWERYPFRVMNHAAQSDFSLSKRLEADDVPIVASRDSFVWHVKEVWNDSDKAERKRMVNGPAQIVLESRYGKERIVA